MEPIVVAIDGPSGSGTSSVSQEVARRLGPRAAYLNTGAMYRALVIWCRQIGVDLRAPIAARAAWCLERALEVPTDPDKQTWLLLDRDITEEIRSAEVTAAVSRVAGNLAVRPVLQGWQRVTIALAKAEGRHVVAEGRDIATKVAPGAKVRLLLTASEDVRMARRVAQTGDPELAAVLDSVRRRDSDDSAVARFMAPAPGVTEIDSTELDFAQTVEAVIEQIRLVAPDVVPERVAG